jgi:hypothetical protein
MTAPNSGPSSAPHADPDELLIGEASYGQRDFEAGVAQALRSINSSRVEPHGLVHAIASGYSPSQVGPGQLRPYVPPLDPQTQSWEYADIVDRALRLLLYAPEVIIDEPTLWMALPRTDDPHHAPDWLGETGALLRSLDDVWHLVEDGSLLLGQMDSHPMWDLPPEAKSLAEGFTEAERDHWNYQLMAMEHWLQGITPWFLSGRQFEAAQSLVHRVDTGAGDRRVLQLPKLAALELPSLKLRREDLIAVRRSSDAFAEWRQHLGTALSQVELLPDTDAWQREARAIIADELVPYAGRVRSETARSSALANSVVGMRQLAVSGISAAGAGLVGTPADAALVGLGTAGVGTFLSVVSDWVRARRSAAPNRAVLQLAMMFDDRTR